MPSGDDDTESDIGDVARVAGGTVFGSRRDVDGIKDDDAVMDE